MTDQIVLTVPDEISERARQIAATTARPVEEVLLDHLKTHATPQPRLPSEEQAELDALKNLSDDTLWTIARERMPEAVEARAHDLMDRNASGQFAESDYAELKRIVQRADRLMLRKAEAAAILKQRNRA